MLTTLLPLLALLPLTLAQAPPIQGNWTLTNIQTSGPISKPGTCATCWPGPPNNTVTFTIEQTNTTCSTTWLPPNKPIDWVLCDDSNYNAYGSAFSFKFPVGEATSYGAFTPIIQFFWVFPVGPPSGTVTESIPFQGEKFITDLDCEEGPPGEDIHCIGGPVEIAIGS